MCNIEDIALTLTPRLGVRGVVELLRIFSTAQKIFSASREEMVHFAQLKGEIADSIVRRVAFGAAQREMEYCRQHGITPIASTDEGYPQLLLETPDYPHVLYVMGDVAALSGRNVSIIGTRRISSYGDRMCFDIVRSLAAEVPDVTIVSGLAYGVDSAAHRAAIHCGARTVAVVANALPGVTPTQHTALAADIIERGGAIVSEFHSLTKPHRNLFISRNRIVAGMSGATVVVESPASGGSMVTAGMADGYGRCVMAVPGRITDSSSAGCNTLIRNQKALICLSGSQIAREMMWDRDSASDRVVVAPLAVDLTAEQKALVSCFESDDPLSIDELCERSGRDVSELNVMLMELELEGVVRMLHGNRYELLSVVTTL